jgi:hypothetical protein
LVESMLESARDAIAARERQQADRALESAESLLRAHPELPQGAWLMAEVERAWSTRFRRVPPLDVEAADRMWARAEALDGGRVPGVGEDESPQHPLPTSLTLDLEPDDTGAWLDGRPLGSQSATFASRAGLHALVVTRGGAPVWAAWIETPAKSSTAHPDAARATPCSADDVALASSSPEGIDGHRVQCPSWIAAIAGQRPENVRLAVCAGGRCGKWVDWPATAPWTRSPTAERGTSSRWPAWATWAAVGAGAIIAVTLVVFASQPTPTETRFVSRGIKTQ